MNSTTLDKAYDITWDYRRLVDVGFTPHVRVIREDAVRRHGARARRWIVNRTHGWLNRFRAPLVRWEKKTVSDEASLHLACACIAYARAGLLGEDLSTGMRSEDGASHPFRAVAVVVLDEVENGSHVYRMVGLASKARARHGSASTCRWWNQLSPDSSAGRRGFA